MNTARKAKLCACSLLVTAMALFCGGCLPVIQSITPNIGEQGNPQVQVTLIGTGFRPNGNTSTTNFYVDGYIGGLYDGIVIDSIGPVTDTTVTLGLNISGSAFLGAHTIVIQTEYGFGNAVTFYVTCQGCMPPPKLNNVVVLTQPSSGPAVSQLDTQLIRGGPPMTFRFIGANFLSNNPGVRIDGSGVMPDPAPPIVYQTGCPDNCMDYFDVPITAAPNASVGAHEVVVTTAAGRSNSFQWLTVRDSNPIPTPSPGTSPVLTKLTPAHVTKGNCFLCNSWVGFKCEGIGFGNNPEILVDNPSLTPVMFYRYHANQDQVAVAVILIPQNFPDSSITVQVRNNNTNTTSNGLVLYLDEQAPDAPFAEGAIDAGVRPGEETDMTIYGSNLDGVTDISFSGIPGLTFSNVQASCCQVSFHVRADPTTPLTGDDVTNLTVTTANGRSNPFSFLVYQ